MKAAATPRQDAVRTLHAKRNAARKRCCINPLLDAHRAPAQHAEHRCPLYVANHAAASGKFLQFVRDRTDGTGQRRPVR